MSSGNKYHRMIYGLAAYGHQTIGIFVDIYSVLTAYEVTEPGLQHAVKKLLCSGIRGKGDRLQDLREARDALDRAIEECSRIQALQAPSAQDQAATKEMWRQRVMPLSTTP